MKNMRFVVNDKYFFLSELNFLILTSIPPFVDLHLLVQKLNKVTYSRIFLAENQLDAPLFIDVFILFFSSLHVSGTMCPSSGETKLC
jgi:hypothetical protein